MAFTSSIYYNVCIRLYQPQRSDGYLVRRSDAHMKASVYLDKLRWFGDSFKGRLVALLDLSEREERKEWQRLIAWCPGYISQDHALPPFGKRN